MVQSRNQPIVVSKISFLFTVITSWCELEELPYINRTCHLCHPLPWWHCSRAFALCVFLVEGNISSFYLFQNLISITTLLLINMFIWQLDLFTTLKALGLIGIFLMFVGHSTLSHIASVSAKVKSA